VSEVSFPQTLRLESIWLLFSATFVFENAKFRYLRIDNKKLITRSGYFSKQVEIPIASLQGMHAVQQSLVYQPNLEIEYVSPDGNRQSLVLNTYVYQNSLPKFLKDTQGMMPNIELDDVCLKTIKSGKWPLLPTRKATR
jgi:hypothetical protein